MSDRFEEEMMEDLLAEPEARSGTAAMDSFDEADEFDEDEFEAADEFDEDEFEAADEFDELEESGEALEAEASEDAFEDAMADALEAEDTDEFFGKLGGFFKKVGRGIGNVARVVAPIASAIPIPQAQLIGRAAGLIGNVMADEGDEMDAFEDLSDYAEEEDALDALAPAVATVAIRAGLKRKTATLPLTQRRALVKTVTAATRHLVRKHGPQAVKALPVILAHANRTALRKRLPARQLPHLVTRAVRAASKSPRLLKRMVRAGAQMHAAHFGHRARTHRGSRYGGTGSGSGARYGSAALATGKIRHRGHGAVASRGLRSAGGSMSPSASCPSCGRRGSWRLEGPVRVTIEGV